MNTEVNQSSALRVLGAGLRQTKRRVLADGERALPAPNAVLVTPEPRPGLADQQIQAAAVGYLVRLGFGLRVLDCNVCECVFHGGIVFVVPRYPLRCPHVSQIAMDSARWCCSISVCARTTL